MMPTLQERLQRARAEIAFNSMPWYDKIVYALRSAIEIYITLKSLSKV